MCLIIDKTKHPDLKPLIAKKDIPVWKLFIDRGDHVPYTVFRKQLIKNKIIAKRAGLPLRAFRMDYDGYSIEPIIREGIHAYINFKSALSNAITEEKAFKFIIPKGTPYFVGHGKKIVALRMLRAK